MSCDYLLDIVAPPTSHQSPTWPSSKATRPSTRRSVLKYKHWLTGQCSPCKIMFFFLSWISVLIQTVMESQSAGTGKIDCIFSPLG